MSTKYFNFNNERALTEIEVNDETGVVELVVDGEVVDFESVNEFAEYYALSRNVVAENLKNWTLTQDGNQVAFVLKAGTAGLTEDELVAMVRSLRIAGMSPEEIGQSVAAAQRNSAVEQAQVEREQNVQSVRSMVEEVIAGLSELDQAVLSLVHGDSHDELVDFLVNADGHGYDAIDTYHEESYWDEEYDEEVDDDEYYGIDAVMTNIFELVAAKKLTLSSQYPDVPLEIVVVAHTGNAVYDAETLNKLNKYIRVSALSGRGTVEVVSVSDELEATIIPVADVVPEGTIVFKLRNRFYVFG